VPAPPFDALRTKLQTIVDRQLALNWTPPALRKALQASLDSVVQIGVTMDIASPNGNAFRPAAGAPTDALSLGVGVSASAAASLSLGLSLGIGVSASASLGLQLVGDLHTAISVCGNLERDLADYNATAQGQAGTNGVMPPGRKVDQGKVNRSLRGLNEQLTECQSKANAAAAARPVAPIGAELRMSRIGEWHCDLDLDQETIEKGKVNFQLDDLEFVGTADPEATGMDGNRAKCTVIAGNGRIRRKIDAHSYSGSNGVKVGTVVRDILKDCGEDLSDLSDAEMLDKKLPRWHVTKGTTAASALTKLADACDAAWRMLRDGTVWFGAETWPEVEPEGTLTNESWSDGCLTLASETPNMIPGTIYQGQKIEHVTHRYGEKLRTDIRTFDSKSTLGGAFEESRHEIDFSREYPCKVVTQHSDGTVQLLPDDEIMRASGLDKVPIRYGLPGFRARLLPGARCHLAFAAGDPSRPYAHNWEFDEDTVESVEIAAGGRSAPIARLGDPVDVFITPGVPAIVGGTITPPGSLFTGTISFTTPLPGVISTGNPRFLG
jgi:hypothetical protein